MGAVVRQQLRELYCRCGGELILHVKMEEDMSAKMMFRIENENPDSPPCFSLDLDSISDVKYTPYFICAKCKSRPFDANQNLEFEEENEFLIFPNYNED